MPKADVIYGCDPHFFDAKRRDGTPYIDEMRRHGAEIWTQDPRAAQKHDLFWIRSSGEVGLGKDHVKMGGNSGYQAVCLAYLWGCTRLVLLGFDMQREHGQDGGKVHWFGDHPKGQNFAGAEAFTPVFTSWVKTFAILGRDLNDAGIDVYNATRTSALTCFPRVAIDALPCL